jgi:hypothetical protein
MKVQKTLITPDYAAQLLKANTKNRRAKREVISKYTKDMSEGRWKEDTYELIKISKTGVILDGQHRLMAVVKSNVPIYFHIVKDLEDSIFDVLDTGSVRNATDVFKINGILQDSTLPSVIGFYYNLKDGGTTKGQKVSVRKTNAELLEIYLLNPEYWQHIGHRAHSLYHSFAKILPPSFIGGFMAFFNDFNDEDADDFMSQLCTGSNIKLQIINILRNKLITEKVSVHKLNVTTKMAFIIKAWNAYRMKQSIKILKYTPSTDNFPVAI